MSTFKIEAQSRLMDSYVVSNRSVIASGSKFHAAQGLHGEAWFCSFGTDDKFYFSQEMDGAETGWKLKDLGADLAQHGFQGQTVRILDFSVRQIEAGALSIAVIARPEEGSDALWVADLKQSKEEGEPSVKWGHCKYFHADYQDVLKMTAVLLSPDRHLALVTVEHKGSLLRFAVELKNEVRWVLANFGTHVVEKQPRMALGRAGELGEPGTFLLQNGGLTYEELDIDADDNFVSPSTFKLRLDGGKEAAVAMAAIQLPSNDDSLRSQLFVASKSGKLFHFADDKEKYLQNLSEGALCFEDQDGLSNCRSLLVDCQQGRVSIWAINGRQELMQYQCDLDQIKHPGAWEQSLPLEYGAESMAGFVNQKQGVKTLFVHTGGNGVTKMERLTDSWKSSEIQLPASTDGPDGADLNRIESHTLKITVTNENEELAPGQVVYIKSESRGAFWVNNTVRYLGENPVGIKADAMGAITLVEPVEDLASRKLYLGLTPNTLDTHIDMNAGAKAQMAQLGSSEKLKGQMVQDDKGNMLSLIPDSLDQNAVDQLAAAFSELGKVGDTDEMPSAGADKEELEEEVVAAFAFNPEVEVAGNQVGAGPEENEILWSLEALPLDVPEAGMGEGPMGTGIWHAFADAFQTMKKYTKSFVLKVKKCIAGAMDFVLEIGGKLIKFTVKLASQALMIFKEIMKKLGGGLKKAWLFLRYAFSWKTIKTHRDRMKTVIKTQIKSYAKMLRTMKPKIKEALSKIDQELEAIIEKLPNEKLAYQPKPEPRSNSILKSPESSWMMDQVCSLIGKSHSDAGKGDDLEDENPFEGIAKELLNQLRSGQLDQVTLAKKMLECIRVSLPKVEEGLEKALETIAKLIDGLADSLDKPITIPYLSEFLEKHLPFWGKFSFLDLVCTIVAVPASLIISAVEQGQAAPQLPGGSAGVARYKVEGAKVMKEYGRLKVYAGCFNLFKIVEAFEFVLGMAEDALPLMQKIWLKFGSSMGFFGSLIDSKANSLVDICFGNWLDDPNFKKFKLVFSLVTVLGSLVGLLHSIAGMVVAYVKAFRGVLQIVYGFAEMGTAIGWGKNLPTKGALIANASYGIGGGFYTICNTILKTTKTPEPIILTCIGVGVGICVLSPIVEGSIAISCAAQMV